MRTKLPSLCLLLCLAACKPPEAPAEVIRPAQVWTVSAQTAASSSTYSGETKARNETPLSFRVGGKLLERKAEVGDTVQAGQVLARLDTTDLNLGVQTAQASLRTARSEQATASAELERNRALSQKGFLSRSALDAYLNRYNAATANVKAASAQTDLAQNQAGYSELKADHDGVVTATYTEAGQVVAAGAPILNLAQQGEREVQIRVGENSLPALKAGTLVNVKLWSQPDKPFQGKVREVAPAADLTRSFLVKISLLNPPDKLRLGVTADVELPNTHASGDSWLPATALFQQAQQPAVWVVGAQNQVQLQAVAITAYREDGVLVSGLKPGMQVVAAGIHKLHAQQAILPVPYDGKAQP